MARQKTPGLQARQGLRVSATPVNRMVNQGPAQVDNTLGRLASGLENFGNAFARLQSQKFQEEQEIKAASEARDKLILNQEAVVNSGLDGASIEKAQLRKGELNPQHAVYFQQALDAARARRASQEYGTWMQAQLQQSDIVNSNDPVAIQQFMNQARGEYLAGLGDAAASNEFQASFLQSAVGTEQNAASGIVAGMRKRMNEEMVQQMGSDFGMVYGNLMNNSADGVNPSVDDVANALSAVSVQYREIGAPDVSQAVIDTVTDIARTTGDIDFAEEVLSRMKIGPGGKSNLANTNAGRDAIFKVEQSILNNEIKMANFEHSQNERTRKAIQREASSFIATAQINGQRLSQEDLVNLAKISPDLAISTLNRYQSAQEKVEKDISGRVNREVYVDLYKRARNPNDPSLVEDAQNAFINDKISRTEMNSILKSFTDQSSEEQEIGSSPYDVYRTFKSGHEKGVRSQVSRLPIDVIDETLDPRQRRVLAAASLVASNEELAFYEEAEARGAEFWNNPVEIRKWQNERLRIASLDADRLDASVQQGGAGIDFTLSRDLDTARQFSTQAASQAEQENQAVKDELASELGDNNTTGKKTVVTTQPSSDTISTQPAFSNRSEFAKAYQEYQQASPADRKNTALGKLAIQTGVPVAQVAAQQLKLLNQGVR